MDLIAEKLIGKELREIQHKAKYDTMIIFEDGSITAWTDVKVSISFGDDPVIVRDVVWSGEWFTILFNEGEIRVSRIPTSTNPECFIYGSIGQPTLMIVDRGEE
ncbi:hypothetical protein [Neorhizobium sp. JUb45]|uniref:hypothetical protein n=1 Tax=unclassified Neorhizobium TaxID=2629175 RepID=UPI0010475D09|nr:hypothetical protein [Neorhizobium sp. JUb45]TCR02156.1 hypothetical protein EDF70_104437 [Neorhizobium sp. JUb45]